MACLIKIVSVSKVIQTISLHSAINLSHKYFFSFYSQPIYKFNMPCESQENVVSSVHNDLELRSCKITQIL